MQNQIYNTSGATAPRAVLATSAPATFVPAPATFVPAPATFAPAPATSVPAPATSVPAPATFAPAPATFAPAPATSVPAPATMRAMFLKPLLFLTLTIIFVAVFSEAYAYRPNPTPTQYLNDRLCLQGDYQQPQDITNNVVQYLNQNLVGFSAGDYIVQEYKGEIFYRYDVFDGVGNKFYVMSDSCQQVIGPYYYTSRIDFFE